MLRIYEVILDILKAIAEAAERIGRRDVDLARQLRRAAASLALNTAGASGVEGGNRRQGYRTALGSAREVRACMDVAVCFRYCQALVAATADRLDRVIATLVKVAR